MRSLKKLWTIISNQGITAGVLKEDAAASDLKRLLKRCPVCNEELSHHSYTLFATTVLGGQDKSNILEFFSSLKEHRWRDARKFKSWEGQRDNAEAYALRCMTGQSAVVIVRSPYELYDSDTLANAEALSVEESQKLSSLIDETEWKPL